MGLEGHDGIDGSYVALNWIRMSNMGICLGVEVGISQTYYTGTFGRKLDTGAGTLF